MIKGIVFDIGGVLAYDIREYLFYEEGTGLISKYGLDKRIVSEIDSILYDKYAYNKIGNKENWEELERQYWDELINHINLQATPDELIEFTKKYVREVSGMMDLVKSLKANNFDLLICSNNTEFSYQRISRLLNLEDYFEERKIILSNRFGASKSSPNFILFEEAERQMEYKKEEYLFVDDRQSNIEKALEFGITPVYFPAEATYGRKYLESIIKK